MANLFPLRGSASGGADEVIWINPDHTVTALEVLTDAGDRALLGVELQLVGTNLFRAWLGTFADAAAANEAWNAFADQVQSK